MLCDLDLDISDDAGQQGDFERLTLRHSKDERLLAYADLRLGQSLGTMQCNLCGPSGVPHFTHAYSVRWLAGPPVRSPLDCDNPRFGQTLSFFASFRTQYFIVFKCCIVCAYGGDCIY